IPVPEAVDDEALVAEPPALELHIQRPVRRGVDVEELHGGLMAQVLGVGPHVEGAVAAVTLAHEGLFPQVLPEHVGVAVDNRDGDVDSYRPTQDRLEVFIRKCEAGPRSGGPTYGAGKNSLSHQWSPPWCDGRGAGRSGRTG